MKKISLTFLLLLCLLVSCSSNTYIQCEDVSDDYTVCIDQDVFDLKTGAHTCVMVTTKKDTGETTSLPATLYVESRTAPNGGENIYYILQTYHNGEEFVCYAYAEKEGIWIRAYEDESWYNRVFE